MYTTGINLKHLTVEGLKAASVDDTQLWLLRPTVKGEELSLCLYQRDNKYFLVISNPFSIISQSSTLAGIVERYNAFIREAETLGACAVVAQDSL